MIGPHVAECVLEAALSADFIHCSRRGPLHHQPIGTCVVGGVGGANDQLPKPSGLPGSQIIHRSGPRKCLAESGTKFLPTNYILRVLGQTCTTDNCAPSSTLGKRLAQRKARKASELTFTGWKSIACWGIQRIESAADMGGYQPRGLEYESFDESSYRLPGGSRNL